MSIFNSLSSLDSLRVRDSSLKVTGVVSVYRLCYNYGRQLDDCLFIRCLTFWASLHFAVRILHFVVLLRAFFPNAVFLLVGYEIIRTHISFYFILFCLIHLNLFSIFLFRAAPDLFFLFLFISFLLRFLLLLLFAITFTVRPALQIHVLRISNARSRSHSRLTALMNAKKEFWSDVY